MNPTADSGAEPFSAWPDTGENNMSEEGNRPEKVLPERSRRWRMQRIKRRIEKGYYTRPEIRAEIVEALLEALSDLDEEELAHT